MARGDIVLYKSQGLWHQKLIVLATHGIYCHVAVMTGENQVIAATFNGIEYQPFTYDASIHTLVSIMPEHATQQGIETGLQWAIQQAGKRYGWLDIVYQAVKFLAPNNPFQLVDRNRFDCSDFASRYLMCAGVQLPQDFQDPYSNTPNDIARIYGLIPLRSA